MKTVVLIRTTLVAAVFCAGPAYAVQEGQSLSAARAELLRDGWRPVKTYLKFKDGELIHLFGDAKDLFTGGYPEVESCTGTGSNVCMFNYQKGVQCGRLTTVGEENHKVLTWSNECPPNQD